MLETGITPDFVVAVDGKEGGTGAAPLEFMDHLGMPLRDGLTFVHAALVRSQSSRSPSGSGRRARSRRPSTSPASLALGADWCNAARGFMFAVGCIQAQQCHTDHCPTGAGDAGSHAPAWHRCSNQGRTRGSISRETVRALAELIAAAGLEHPRELNAHHLMQRAAPDRVVTFARALSSVEAGRAVGRNRRRSFSRSLGRQAQSASFAPALPEAPNSPALASGVTGCAARGAFGGLSQSAAG